MSEEIKTTETVATEATDTEETATPAAMAEAAEPVKTVSTADSELRSMISTYGDADVILPKLHELGFESVDDLSVLEVSDLTGAGMKLAQARKLINNLKNAEAKKAAAEAAAAAPAAMYSTATMMANLPTVSSDESLLKGLQVGGILKVDDSTCHAALHVFIADLAGLFDVREKIRAKMEAQANKIEVPVDPIYWDVLDSITHRNYGDLFAAIKGLNGSYFTPKRRSEFIDRIKTELCPAIRDGYDSVVGWVESYNTMMANPATWAAAARGMAPGLSTCPSVDPVLDASATIKDAFNRVFSGTYMPVAAAMTKDAMDISALLNNPHLPTLVGCESKEIMLKDLGLNVTASVTRCEKALVQFVIGLARFDIDAVGNEPNQIQALYNVGQTIPWSMLISGMSAPGRGYTGPSSIGGGRL